MDGEHVSGFAGAWGGFITGVGVDSGVRDASFPRATLVGVVRGGKGEWEGMASAGAAKKVVADSVGGGKGGSTHREKFFVRVS
eukprot:982254-Prorocentrum_minimum.AAC.2